LLGAAGPQKSGAQSQAGQAGRKCSAIAAHAMVPSFAWSADRGTRGTDGISVIASSLTNQLFYNFLQGYALSDGVMKAA